MYNFISSPFIDFIDDDLGDNNNCDDVTDNDDDAYISLLSNNDDINFKIC